MFSSALVNVAVFCVLIPLARRIVSQHRVVEDQGVHQLRGRRRHGPCFERAVVKVVRPAFSHGLGVGVGQVGLADEDFTGNRTYGPELAVLAQT